MRFPVRGRLVARGTEQRSSYFSANDVHTIFASEALEVAVYLDDVLIYSKSPETRLQHLEQVFEVLWRHGFYCEPSKYHLANCELTY